MRVPIAVLRVPIAVMRVPIARRVVNPVRGSSVLTHPIIVTLLCCSAVRAQVKEKTANKAKKESRRKVTDWG